MATFKVVNKRPVKVAGVEIGPTAFRVTESIGDGFQVRATFRFVDGRYICEGIAVAPSRSAKERKPVTADLLRKISAEAPVEEMAREGLLVAFDHLGAAIPRPPDTSKGPTPEGLKAVATVYRLAFALGENPTQEVAKYLGRPWRTAARWVQRARNTQPPLLGDTDQRKAGI